MNKTDQRKEIFLKALGAGHSVVSAAGEAGVNRRQPYDWRVNDKAFASAWAEALEAGTDVIEQEAFRRAVEGVEKPVYRGSEIVGHITDYSDSMLMFLLKARRPDKYKDRAADKGEKALDIEGARDALLRKFAEITTTPDKA